MAIGAIVLAVAAPAAMAAKTTVRTIGGAVSGTTGGLFKEPRGIAINKTGNGTVPAGTFYVADTGNNRVQRFGPAGEFISAWGWDTIQNGSPSDLGGVTSYQVCAGAADCKAGTTGVNPGQFGGAGIQGIAVDQARGLVYVSDQTDRRVSVFSALGVFQGAFGFGVVNGATALQYCTTVCSTAAAAGSDAGRFSGGLGGLAVDSAGNLYVANKTSRRVDVFKPVLAGSVVTGVEYLRGFGWGVDTGAAAFEVCTAASACNAPAAAGTGLGQFATNSPTDLAFDSAGNLFALDGGNKRVQKFDVSATPTPVTAAFGAGSLTAAFGTGSLYSIAIDTVNDHVYIVGSNSANANKIAVAEVDAAEVPVATHGTDLAPNVAAGLGVAPEAIGGNLYVSSNNSGHRVYVLNNAPTMDPVATFSGTTANFSGSVVSNNSATTYHFEYSVDGVDWTKVPTVDASAGTAAGTIPVAQNATGLVGSQIYRVRLVQTRAAGGGIAISNEQTFTTAPSAPVIVGTAFSAVTTASALLEADVNPEQQATTYRFEYGSADCSANPCASIPIPDGTVGSGAAAVHVSREIVGLAPDTVYHFRVVASNSTGATPGPDRTLRTFPAEASSVGCPNAAFRTGPAAHLADCRAYEMVSPLDKNGGDILALPTFNTTALFTSFKQGSLDGSKVTYSAGKSFGDALSAPWSSQYISSRGDAGWSTHAINAPRGTTVFGPILELGWDQANVFEAFTPDLSSAWLRDDNLAPLTSAGLAGCVNLYRRDNLTDGFEALTNEGPYPSTAFTTSLCSASSPGKERLRFQGFSEDLKHMIFIARGALTLDAVQSTSNYQLYDLHDGTLNLVSRLPDGSVNPASSFAGKFGALNENRTSMVEHAISTDGSRIFWTSSAASEPHAGRIYLRLNPAEPQSAIVAGECTESAKACTIPVSESVSAADASFWGAAANGSDALFTIGEDLYEFDVAGRTPTLIAHQSSGVLGASDDLSRIYFVSKEALDTGAVAGQRNLYLRSTGEDSFIATLADKDFTTGLGIPGPVTSEPLFRTSRVTPDGAQIAFSSFSSPTGYDNTDTVTGGADLEVFHYDADLEEMTCVSCNPSGARPTGVQIEYPYSFSGYHQNITDRYAGILPTCEHENYCSRALSDDGGRVYFHSSEALVPQDTNGAQDVYQWEAKGIGRCTRVGGCVDLISTGKSSEESEFYDASANGSDVFFSTQSSIDPRDEGLIDVYDARVGGGFPLPPTVPDCVGDACHSSPPGPSDATLGSAAVLGNPPLPRKAGCPKGKRAVRKNGKTRCVKWRHRRQKERTRKKHRTSHDRRAGR